MTAGSTFSIGSLNGPLQANNGLVSATTSIGVLYGGTGLSTVPSYGQLLMGQANGTYALVATSSLGIAGGSGSGTVGSGTQGQFAFYNAAGTALTATSTLYVSQRATWHRHHDPRLAFLLNKIANFTAATSTFYSSGGINLYGGCFGINGNCLGLANLAGSLNLASQVAGILGVNYGGTGTTSATGAISNLLYLSSAASTSQSRSIQAKLDDVVSVKDFGRRETGY